MKGNYDSISEKNEFLAREFDISVKEKNEIEKANSNAMSKLKAHLDQKIKDNELLKQNQITPTYPRQRHLFDFRDMEISRFKTMEEFELNLKKKWRGFENEIGKYRKSYFQLKKDHEELISETSRLV